MQLVSRGLDHHLNCSGSVGFLLFTGSSVGPKTVSSGGDIGARGGAEATACPNLPMRILGDASRLTVAEESIDRFLGRS